jgi:hypothetical protein
MQATYNDSKEKRNYVWKIPLDTFGIANEKETNSASALPHSNRAGLDMGPPGLSKVGRRVLYESSRRR